MPPELVPVLVSIGAIALLSAVAIALYAKSMVRVQQGQALIVNRVGKTSVHFTGAMVVPILHRAVDAKGIAKATELTARRRMDSARIESQCKELLVELERVERDALARLRDATGAELRREELEERLRDRLRELVSEELDR